MGYFEEFIKSTEKAQGLLRLIVGTTARVIEDVIGREVEYHIFGDNGVGWGVEFLFNRGMDFYKKHKVSEVVNMTECFDRLMRKELGIKDWWRYIDVEPNTRAVLTEKECKEVVRRLLKIFS